jgi:uncharacterized membrane protein YhdT
MMAGAVAFFLYAFFVSWVMMPYRFKALSGTLGAMPRWFATAARVHPKSDRTFRWWR